MYNFCVYGGNTLSVVGEATASGVKFFTVGIFRKEASKYGKLILGPHIWDNLNQIYRFFHF